MGFLRSSYDDEMIWIAGTVVNLNPTASVYLGCGTGTKVEPAQISDDIEANILVLKSYDQSKKIVVISVDTLFLGNYVSRTLVSRLGGAFSPDEIFLAATHSHTAPMVDETKPNLGIVNQEYTLLLLDRIVSATLDLMTKPLVLAHINSWEPSLGGIVSRRSKRIFDVSRNGLRFQPVLQRPNFRNYGRRLPANVVEFVDEEGFTLATLAVIPCHPVAFQGLDFVSADIAGAIRLGFRNITEKSKQTPFIFLQGASGDLNPWWKRGWLSGGLLNLVDQFVNGPTFPVFTKQAMSSWSSKRLKELVSKKPKRKGIVPSPRDAGFGSSLLQVPLSHILESAVDKDQRFFTVHTIEIGDLRFVGVSAEVTWEFKKEILPLLEGGILVGCIRDSFGYVSSSKQYREGGYEASGHQSSFSISHFENSPPAMAVSSLVSKTT